MESGTLSVIIEAGSWSVKYQYGCISYVPSLKRLFVFSCGKLIFVFEQVSPLPVARGFSYCIEILRLQLRYRNRRIGDFLKELKLTQGRNTGIPAVLHALKQNNSEPPIFETDAERTYFKVIFAVNKKFLPGASDNVLSAGVRRTSAELRRAIVAALSEKGEMSVRELSRSLGYGNVTNSVYKEVGHLIEEGRMEYSLPEKKNSRNQKVRLR